MDYSPSNLNITFCNYQTKPKKIKLLSEQQNRKSNQKRLKFIKEKTHPLTVPRSLEVDMIIVKLREMAPLSQKLNGTKLASL